MASNNSSLSFVLLLLFFISATLLPPCSCTEASMVAADPPQKVNVTVYYDSLSQASAVFVVKDVDSLFQNHLIDFVNLRLVPWGNGHLEGKISIICQHGPEECLMNTLQTCAISIWPPVVTHYGWIHCMELLATQGRAQDWQNCSHILGLSHKSILRCSEDKKINGTAKSLEYIDEVAHLNPPLAFVPWVLVNNQPIRQNYQNFQSYICNIFGSSGVPEVCKSLPQIGSPLGYMN